MIRMYLNSLVDYSRYFVIIKSSLEKLMFQHNFAIMVYTFKLNVSLFRNKLVWLVL